VALLGLSAPWPNSPLDAFCPQETTDLSSVELASEKRETPPAEISSIFQPESPSNYFLKK
jgi:hypothetical protein